MVVKGHHFPNVTLVGVVAADSSLNIDNYKANETTFDLLVQVAGRAGREKLPGKVIIQTYNPDNFCIEYAQKQDYKLFFDAEIPMPEPNDKIKNRYRWRMILKTNVNDNVINNINEILDKYYLKKYKNTRVIVDINPNNLL